MTNFCQATPISRIAAPDDATAFQSTTYLGEDIRIASTWRSFSTLEGQAYLEISVAQTLTGLNQSIARISRISLAIGFGFFLLSMVVAMVIAQTTIRPLHRLTGSVSRRGPSDLRPVAAPVPTEMAPLVTSLNSLMTRLQNPYPDPKILLQRPHTACARPWPLSAPKPKSP